MWKRSKKLAKINHFRTSKIDPQVVSKTAQNRQYLTPPDFNSRAPVSCANYYLVFEPSFDSRGLIDGFEGEGYGRE